MTIANPAPPSIWDRCSTFAGDIKISHTVFAMPWALMSTFLAASSLPHHVPRAGQLALILICMVTARTVAMAANRLLDAQLDAANPRTARRALPAGHLSRTFYWTITAASAVAFILSTAGFRYWYRNPLPLALSIPVLAFLCAYPLLKRFTRLCHYYLGAALALAPVCAWIAIKGTIELPPLIMAAAVLAWTAGFDIIYACQDYESDLRTGTFSVPAKLGIARALWVARLTHAFAAAMLVLLGFAAHPPLATLYAIAVAIAIALLLIEHSLVRATALSRVNLAFFTVNGIISLVIGTLGILDVFV